MKSLTRKSDNLRLLSEIGIDTDTFRQIDLHTETLDQRIGYNYLHANNQANLLPSGFEHLCRRIINDCFSAVSEIVYFDFVPYEPYSYTKVSEMNEDYSRAIIKVNTTGNNSDFWGPYYNLQFRAIHDYIHVKHNLDFNLDDEIKAFYYQTELMYATYRPEKHWYPINWELLFKVMRSEIIYQSAWKQLFGELHPKEQKIILTAL